jgi:hypothetical protein
MWFLRTMVPVKEWAQEREMQVLAGTSRGLFRINEGHQREPVLQEPGVRDLIRIGDRIHAGASTGHFLSDDNGATWQRSNLPELEVWQIRQGGDCLYAGVQPAGLWRSTDRGESWVEVEGFARLADEHGGWGIPIDPPIQGRLRALVIDRTDPRRIAAGVEVGGIALTEDGGESWRMVLPGDNPDLHMMFQHPTRPATLFASTGYGRPDGIAEMVEGNAGVFRSDDGGATWGYAWKGITPRYSRPMCIDDRAPHALTVASAPTAFSHYKDDGGAAAMLYRSTDGGESWRSLCDAAHSPSAANFHGLNVDPENAGGVLTGTDTGEVWRVSDGGDWTEIASGMPSVLAVMAV